MGRTAKQNNSPKPCNINVFWHKKRTLTSILTVSISALTVLARLVEFFPTINMDKLTSIDNFHAGISSILKESLKATQSELEAAIEILDSQISALDSQMDEMIDLQDAPKYTVERLLELAAQKSQFEKAKELYEKKESMEEDLLSAKKDFAQIKSGVLADIQSQINTSMYDANKRIHTDGRRAPDLQLKDSSYDFKVFNDTGTGKAYASLTAPIWIWSARSC